MGKEPFDSFFDRDKLNDMSTEEPLDKLTQSEKDSDDWNEQNPDPLR